MITKTILLITGEKNIYSLFDNMNATGLKKVLILAFVLGAIFSLFILLVIGNLYLFITS